MLLPQGKTRQWTRSITPGKTNRRLVDTQPKAKKKQTKERNVAYKQNKSALRTRTRDTYSIIQHLQEIYATLSFNDFDVFPVEEIEVAKRNIKSLCETLGKQPVCRDHGELLNLYCETDKKVICVDCAYKANMQHRQHKIRDMDSMRKILDLQTVRNQQKSRSIADRLTSIKEQVQMMSKDISQNFSAISRFTISIIDQSISELKILKAQMQQKLTQAYSRTTTVMKRYNEALVLMINHIDENLVLAGDIGLSNLARHLLLKELTGQAILIDELYMKFNENKLLMDQWRISKNQFQKVVQKKEAQITSKLDSFVVTQF